MLENNIIATSFEQALSNVITNLKQQLSSFEQASSNLERQVIATRIALLSGHLSKDLQILEEPPEITALTTVTIKNRLYAFCELPQGDLRWFKWSSTKRSVESIDYNPLEVEDLEN